jgi:solute carrier family 25 (adenine nucleotide translocator) protein 4/5/6/31
MNFLADFAAGGISGAVAKTATAPIERVKLIIQTQDANPKIKSGEVKRYTGIADCFTRVYSEQGMGAFWRGNMTNVIRYFPTQAFNFAFKDTIKALFPKYSPKTDFFMFFMVNMASGGLAGAGSLCIYNGFGVSVAGIIPYRGVYFGMFDSLIGINPFRSDRGLVGLASKFAIAQVTAITAGYASYPFDTIRRRLQMQSEKPQSEWLYKGTVDCFFKILKDEGTGALFKGAGANALRTVGSALVLVLYGEIKTAMGFEGGAGGSE